MALSTPSSRRRPPSARLLLTDRPPNWRLVAADRVGDIGHLGAIRGPPAEVTGRSGISGRSGLVCVPVGCARILVTLPDRRSSPIRVDRKLGWPPSGSPRFGLIG